MRAFTLVLYRFHRSYLYTQLCKISKRVEGNAGQILDEAPKNKPYFAYEGRIFSAFKLAIILITFMYCKAFSYPNARI